MMAVKLMMTVEDSGCSDDGECERLGMVGYLRAEVSMSSPY